MRTWVGAAGLVGAMLFGATEAHAQESDASGDKVYMASQHAGADLYWYSASLIGSTFALVPTGNIQLAENIYLDFWAPVGMNVGSEADKPYAGIGNPTVGAHYAKTDGPLTFYVGGRAGIPLVQAFDDQNQRIATLFSAVSMAYWDNYLWTPYLPVGGFGGVEYVANEVLRVRGELAPTFMIPFEGRDAEFQYQIRLEGEARHESHFGGGLGLQGVHLLTQSGNNGQVAVEPFGAYDNGSIFLRLGLLTAIDDPLGFGFDEGPGKVATLRFRFGLYF